MSNDDRYRGYRNIANLKFLFGTNVQPDIVEEKIDPVSLEHFMLVGYHTFYPRSTVNNLLNQITRGQYSNFYKIWFSVSDRFSATRKNHLKKFSCLHKTIFRMQDNKYFDYRTLFVYIFSTPEIIIKISARFRVVSESGVLRDSDNRVRRRVSVQCKNISVYLFNAFVT